jgi:hypothetical protein
MPSKTPPISLRLGANRLELLDAHAATQGLTRHAAILGLIDRGLSVTEVTGPPPPKVTVGKEAPVSSAPRQVLAQAEAKAAHLAHPRPRRRWTLDVPFGPPDCPAGSRLKGGGLHPKKK